MRDYRIIAVDFDGTLSCNALWPALGLPNMKLITCLKTWRELGDKVILWTCRNGELLNEAVEWCKKYGLKFDAVNENLPEVIALYENDSRKVSADLYIDDKSVAPLRINQANKLAVELAYQLMSNT